MSMNISSSFKKAAAGVALVAALSPFCGVFSPSVAHSADKNSCQKELNHFNQVTSKGPVFDTGSPEARSAAKELVECKEKNGQQALPGLKKIAGMLP